MTQWQSIDTAPKDGSLVRLKSPLFAPEEPFFWNKVRWETRVFALARVVRGCWGETEEQPTHWKPA